MPGSPLGLVILRDESTSCGAVRYELLYDTEDITSEAPTVGYETKGRRASRKYLALVEIGREYFYVFIRLTNDCGRGQNLYIRFTKVRATATAEPIDLSDYLITKEQYADLPTAVIEEVELTEQDREAIKEKLLPRVAGLVGKWGIKPASTHIEL